MPFSLGEQIGGIIHNVSRSTVNHEDSGDDYPYMETVYYYDEYVNYEYKGVKYKDVYLREFKNTRTSANNLS